MSNLNRGLGMSKTSALLVRSKTNDHSGLLYAGKVLYLIINLIIISSMHNNLLQIT